MPTRPVTWELDIPPASLLQSASKTPVANEVPGIQKLRSSLMGSRFEMLKVSTFATCLLAFLGLAIHGSHLASSDNQFAANAAFTIETLATNVSRATVSVRGKSEALASAMVDKIRSLAGHASPATSMRWAPPTITKSKPTADKHPGRVMSSHRQPRAASATHLNTASLHQALATTEAPETAAPFKILLTPDSMAAGIMGLLLYVLFAVVLIRKRGGLRAFGDRPAI